MKKAIFLTSILILIMGLVAIGCASTTSNSPPASGQSPKTAIATEQAAKTTGTPNYGGSLKMIEASCPAGSIGWPADSVNLAVMISQYCLETLIQTDFQGNIMPGLATSWQLAPDNKSITFTLRKGVKFHDGTDFNANAVKFDFDAGIAAKRFPEFKSVDVIDDYTVRVNLNQYQNITMLTFRTVWAYIASPTAFQKNGVDWARENLVGTGPFKQVELNRDVSFKAIKNENYWQKGKPYVDSVEVLFIKDANTQIIGLKTGQGNILDSDTGKAALDLQQAGYTIDHASIGTATLVPDSANPSSPFAKPSVRQAVEYAIDKESIAKALSFGFWGAAYQLPYPGSPIYDPNFAGRKYDPDKAKQLLTAAGYPNGFETAIIANTQSIWRDLMPIFQNQLAKVNIKATLEFPEQAKYNQYRDVSGWQNALFGYNMGYNANYNSNYQNIVISKNILVSMSKSQDLADKINTSLLSPNFDVVKANAVKEQIFNDTLFIPIYYTERCFIYPSTLHDPGFFHTSSQQSYRSEDAWFSK
jgi:peptide/nickel transport system substrate-binding protein